MAETVLSFVQNQYQKMNIGMSVSFVGRKNNTSMLYYRR